MKKIKTLVLFGILGAVLFQAAPALAKCTLTLKFTNDTANKITVLGSESQARVNGGTWSKMSFNNVTLAPGASDTTSWTTNMSCGGSAKRDFRIKYEDKSTNVIYSDTSKNDIDIYDGQTLKWSLNH